MIGHAIAVHVPKSQAHKKKKEKKKKKKRKEDAKLTHDS